MRKYGEFIMPVVKVYPARMAQFFRDASAVLKKDFLVRTNPLLPRLNVDIAVKPEQYGRANVLPVEISPTTGWVDNRGSITAEAEYNVTFVAAHYPVQYDGYTRTEVGGIGINRSKAALWLQPSIMAGMETHLLPNCYNYVHYFALGLKINNLLTDYDYDPIEQAEKKFYRTFEDYSRRFSDQQIATEAEEAMIDLAGNPEIIRIILFDKIVQIASLYIYLPQSARDVLMNTLGSMLGRQMISFLKSIDIDPEEEASELLGYGFRSRYTPSEHRDTINRAFDFLVGNEGCLTLRTIEQEDEERMNQGKVGLELDGYYSAYDSYCKVVSRDVSERIDTAKRALIRKVSSEHPSADPKSVNLLILAEMVRRGMKKAAIIFQQDVLGVDTDLDYLTI